MHFMFVHPGLKVGQHQQTLVMFDKYNLKLGCLNIAGNANVKCRNDDIIRMISRYDIFTILESWLDPDDACPLINGFANFRSERKKKCKSKPTSGGLIIYCHQELLKGVTKIKSSYLDMIWLKLDHSYFGLPQDLYICVAYLVPDSSPYARDNDIFKESQMK